jgi:hypothetical protein
VGEAYSEYEFASSGVPQGSVLGPLLFVVYINDLPRNTNSPTSMFADDTKVYEIVKHLANNIKLQGNITSLDLWCILWLMEFNSEKCHLLQIGRDPIPRNYTMLSKEGLVTPIQSVNVERDLGVTIDDKLQFREHIRTQVAKANSILATDCKKDLRLPGLQQPTAAVPIFGSSLP